MLDATKDPGDIMQSVIKTRDHFIKSTIESQSQGDSIRV